VLFIVKAVMIWSNENIVVVKRKFHFSVTIEFENNYYQNSSHLVEDVNECMLTRNHQT
jgi:hypothetical protein